MVRRRLLGGIGLSLIGAWCVTALVVAAGPSPVADAAMQGDRDATRSLLKQGADVNAAQSDGMTALHWAAVKNDVELARMLLYAGANVKAATRIGAYTPLLMASKNGDAPMIETLLSAGADPNSATTNGASALMLAGIEVPIRTATTMPIALRTSAGVQGILSVCALVTSSAAPQF